MRSDYALYVVAIICFIVTGAVAAIAMTQQLWIVTTAVLGLVFIGLGYTQRPREPVVTQMAVAPPPPPILPKVTEVAVAQEKKVEPVATVEAVVQTAPVGDIRPSSLGLLQVKGIKEKRAQQLKAVGINTVEDLAKASPEDLASKLKIAPYFTGKWIENAKEIVGKS